MNNIYYTLLHVGFLQVLTFPLFILLVVAFYLLTTNSGRDGREVPATTYNIHTPTALRSHTERTMKREPGAVGMSCVAWRRRHAKVERRLYFPAV